MNIFNNKKGQIWRYLIAAIIAIVVVTLIILWFKGGGEKGFGVIDNKLEGLKNDADGDGVKDAIDKCPNSDSKEVNSIGCTLKQAG